MYKYKTNGTCSRQIDIEVEGNTIKKVQFIGGCSGSAQGVAKLVEGMDIDNAIEKLKGIDCDGKGTSCPDQLSRALQEILLR